MRYKFAINPVPLTRRKIFFLINLGRTLHFRKIKFSYEYTTKEKGAEKIAHDAALEGYDVVVACGGDGTIMEVISGIYRTKSALGILPLGTSNDFAKHLGISSLHKAADSLLGGRRRKIDIGRAEFISDGKLKEALFCSTSGVGLDAKLLRLNKKKFMIKLKKVMGGLVYPLFGFALMFSYKSPEVEISIQGKKSKTRLFLLNANFVKSMGGMKVTPGAGTNNGGFEIFMVRDAPMHKKVAGMAWYSFTSRRLKFKEISHFSGIDEFSINSKNPVEVQLNGDFVGYTPARFKVIPNGIDLIA